ncbi:hypothetical protein, partial [Thermus scotoductus]|uniref:hypothetical protein n=1 Tax=Thermus scotoductus TaxID=37636 RepID=UPI00100282A5
MPKETKEEVKEAQEELPTIEEHAQALGVPPCPAEAHRRGVKGLAVVEEGPGNKVSRKVKARGNPGRLGVKAGSLARA